jgi:hypothetical protein
VSCASYSFTVKNEPAVSFETSETSTKLHGITFHNRQDTIPIGITVGTPTATDVSRANRLIVVNKSWANFPAFIISATDTH